jgi:hypothetical protein
MVTSGTHAATATSERIIGSEGNYQHGCSCRSDNYLTQH